MQANPNSPNPVKGAHKPHARLTQQQAVDIFRVRNSAPSAVKIAAFFDINEKTVRDIWAARTWSRETSHLDPTRTVELKQAGRPKGCRDSKPRKKRVGSTRAVSQVDTPGATSSENEAAHGGYFTPQGPYENDGYISRMNSTNLSTGLHGARNSISSGESSENRPSTRRVASVDDQLYNWGEEFWTSSKNKDPFINDWQAVHILRINQDRP